MKWQVARRVPGGRDRPKVAFRAWMSSAGILGVALVSLVCAPRKPAPSQVPLVNFAHLDHLCEWATMGGDSVVILHVYAEHPDYHWVAAPSEGIACVDDAARAAVLLVRYASLTGDTSR
ncbi:MAG: hypothetical protein H5U38_09535, partial [Calditrichaeota bacterium]|nr:hypothetical protein [Calditrichota bacterium]